jgi:phosphatidylinositol-4,5-bisphosphate 3-kinase catalytic subunit alpha/beta/delta
MEVPYIRVRFGLILEAYCYGNVQYLPKLQKQLEWLSRLQDLGEEVKKKPNKEKQRAALHELLGQNRAKETFNNLVSPLDPSLHCSKVV